MATLVVATEASLWLPHGPAELSLSLSRLRDKELCLR